MANKYKQIDLKRKICETIYIRLARCMSGTQGIEERKLKKPDLTLIDAAVGQKGHTSVPFQGNVSNKS
jgi:hypothetical protein